MDKFDEVTRRERAGLRRKFPHQTMRRPAPCVARVPARLELERCQRTDQSALTLLRFAPSVGTISVAYRAVKQRPRVAAMWHSERYWRNRERLLIGHCCGRGRPHSERWFLRQALTNASALGKKSVAGKMIYFGARQKYSVAGSRCGGIGRRARLKIWYSYECVGSTPSVGTIFSVNFNLNPRSP